MKTLILASYSGSQKGYTVRNYSLEQQSFVNLGFNINGITAGINEDLFLTSANSIYHYQLDGTPTNKIEFPATDIRYTDLVLVADKIVVAYSGSQKGVTIRNKSLEEDYHIPTDFDILGVTADINNDLFLVSAEAIYHYQLDGELINRINAPSIDIQYTAATIVNNDLIVSFGGPQKGFIIFPQLVQKKSDFDRNNPLPFSNVNQRFNQDSQPSPGNMGGFNQDSQPSPGKMRGFPLTYFVPTEFDINGIVAGVSNDVFLVGGNEIYRYGLDGTQLDVKIVDGSRIDYTSISTLIIR